MQYILELLIRYWLENPVTGRPVDEFPQNASINSVLIGHLKGIPLSTDTYAMRSPGSVLLYVLITLLSPHRNHPI